MSIRFTTGAYYLQQLYNAAERTCRGNLRRFGDAPVLVEGGGYEKIWLETQPMGGEMYYHRSPEAGLNNTLMFMRHQRADGRLPGSIEYRDGQLIPQYDKLQGFCFAFPALNLWYLADLGPAYLEELADCLRRFDEYLWRTREKDGVLCSYCVYDTGEDNALRYGNAPRWWPEDEPPRGYRAVPMQSMDVTSYSYSCRSALARISRLRGDGREAYWREQAQDVARRLKDRLWSEARGAMFDRDATGRRINVLTHGTLRCMYWGSISRSMADRFVVDHLLNEREFMTRVPLPSVAMSDPAFRNNPGNDWSGQPQGLTFLRSIRALENYGWDQTLPVLAHRIFGAVVLNDFQFSQQYDPISRAVTSPRGDYGPTALAVLEYVAHMMGVRQELGKIIYSINYMIQPYEYRLTWRGDEYVLCSTGKWAMATVNGRRIYNGPCGVRVILDPRTGAHQVVPRPRKPLPDDTYVGVCLDTEAAARLRKT